MTEPVWLSTEIVLGIHGELLAQFGGEDGLRDTGGFAYGERDISAPAAAYAFALSRRNAFIDGNKRVALSASERRRSLGLKAFRRDFPNCSPRVTGPFLGRARLEKVGARVAMRGSGCIDFDAGSRTIYASFFRTASKSCPP